MLPVGLSVKFIAVGFYLSTVLYVQLRGHVRHKLKRLAADHANVLAPSFWCSHPRVVLFV